MNPILTAILTAGSIGFCGMIIRCVRKYYTRHKQHHAQLDTYPQMFEKHADEHSQIKSSLVLVQRGNVSQIRAQLVQIHERAIHEGKISTHWKSTFYELYSDYKALGGNGFIESLKEEIDDL